jgi:hypothetical protein
MASSTNDHEEKANFVFEMDDPLKAAQMEFESDKPLATRRLSGIGPLRSTVDGIGLSSLRTAPNRDFDIKREDVGMSEGGFGGHHSHYEAIRSAPVRSHGGAMSAHWQTSTPSWAHDTMSLGMAHPHSAGAHSSASQAASHHSTAMHSGARMSDDRRGGGGDYHGMHAEDTMHGTHSMHGHGGYGAMPMSAPIRASDGTISQAFFREHAHAMDGNPFGSARAYPTPKRMKTNDMITPAGTPHKDTHSSSMWAPTPDSGTRADPNFAAMMGAAAMPTMHGMPGVNPAAMTAYGAMDAATMQQMMKSGAIPTPYAMADPSAFQAYGMAGYPAPGMWHGAMPYPSPPGSYADMMSPSTSVESRRRRKARARASKLEPKVPRPDRQTAAEKWKSMTKKDRERARRAELKECYQDLSDALNLEAKRSGAQLPDRADIVRSACEEIRRLERSLGQLQGAPKTDTIKEHVKNSVQ